MQSYFSTSAQIEHARLEKKFQKACAPRVHVSSTRRQYDESTHHSAINPGAIAGTFAKID